MGMFIYETIPKRELGYAAGPWPATLDPNMTAGIISLPNQQLAKLGAPQTAAIRGRIAPRPAKGIIEGRDITQGSIGPNVTNSPGKGPGLLELIFGAGRLGLFGAVGKIVSSVVHLSTGEEVAQAGPPADPSAPLAGQTAMALEIASSGYQADIDAMLAGRIAAPGQGDLSTAAVEAGQRASADMPQIGQDVRIDAPSPPEGIASETVHTYDDPASAGLGGSLAGPTAI